MVRARGRSAGTHLPPSTTEPGADVLAGRPTGLLGVLGADFGGQLGLQQLGHHPSPTTTLIASSPSLALLMMSVLARRS